MNIQELEEMDFNAGRATELQNLFAQSKGETTLRKLNMSEVEKFSMLGFYVVAQSWERFCVWTDAFLGCDNEIYLVTDKGEEAAQFENEQDFIVFYPEKVARGN